MKRLSAILLALTSAAGPSGAVDLTVYNDNLALVRDERALPLREGVAALSFTDVPAQIDATSVHFKSLTDPDGVRVLEQNFQYDLVSQDKLLDRYIGREVEFERPAGPGGEKKEVLRGTLLSAQGGRVLQVGKKLYLNPAGNPVLPELPEGFVTRPTLAWTLSSRRGGAQNCEISYLTSGLGWQADYVLVTNAKDERMDLNAWVTVTNQSGAAFKDAKLKLVAGDVHRVAAPHMNRMARKEMLYAADAMAAPQFEEKAFFEYHLYTLQRPTTLQNNETKQIEMASVSDAPVRKIYIYAGVEGIGSGYYDEYQRSDAGYGMNSQKKVRVMLEFRNAKDAKLGMPLPKGKIRVYKKDADGAVAFVGEDLIDHTPKDEDVRIRVGDAFDIVGERTRTNFVSEKRAFQETFEIKLRNHKEEDVTVRVVERLYRWNNWKILDSTRKYAKKNADTIEYDVPVSKNGESTLTYTVRYSW